MQQSGGGGGMLDSGVGNGGGNAGACSCGMLLDMRLTRLKAVEEDVSGK
jgi:hypothetical protein